MEEPNLGSRLGSVDLCVLSFLPPLPEGRRAYDGILPVPFLDLVHRLVQAIELLFPVFLAKKRSLPAKPPVGQIGQGDPDQPHFLAAPTQGLRQLFRRRVDRLLTIRGTGQGPASGDRDKVPVAQLQDDRTPDERPPCAPCAPRDPPGAATSRPGIPDRRYHVGR